RPSGHPHRDPDGGGGAATHSRDVAPYRGGQDDGRSAARHRRPDHLPEARARTERRARGALTRRLAQLQAAVTKCLKRPEGPPAAPRGTCPLAGIWLAGATHRCLPSRWNCCSESTSGQSSLPALRPLHSWRPKSSISSSKEPSSRALRRRRWSPPARPVLYGRPLSWTSSTSPG